MRAVDTNRVHNREGGESFTLSAQCAPDDRAEGLPAQRPVQYGAATNPDRARAAGDPRNTAGTAASPVLLLAAPDRRYGGGVAPIPFTRLFGTSGRRAVESIVPRRTFDDVILPPATRRALDTALAQVTQHDLIFNRWGLGERHPTGLALAFNFAGPPGTGKTICAEAIAHSLGRRLLLVRYAELESLWMGETPKNVAAIFRTARDERAVLLFDEADAIAARRSTSVDHGFQRESNTVVSVLLQELEWYNGVVIFATNLAANFDPAFERRIRTHVLFEMPGEAERAQIWRVQLHPARTPLAADVDFQALARRYEVSGGDIRNAVLKAALAAAAEPGPDSAKRIHQHHFEAGIEEVIAGKRVMRQSLFAGELTRAAAGERSSPARRRPTRRRSWRTPSPAPRCSWRSSRSRWPCSRESAGALFQGYAPNVGPARCRLLTGCPCRPPLGAGILGVSG